MGENMGVGGAEGFRLLRALEVTAMDWLVSAVDFGNASQVDVTSNDFSTARRYFPMCL